MTAFPATIPIKLDEAGRIAVDLHCPACGYNLRMHRLTPAIPSVKTEALQQDGADGKKFQGQGEAGGPAPAESAWALGDEIGEGAPIEGKCPECGAGIDVSLRAEADQLERSDPAWRARVRRGVRWLHRSAVVSILLVLPGLVGAAAALWLLTTREPGRKEGWMARGTRLSARWASVASALAGIALVVLLIRRGAEVAAVGFSPTAILARDWIEMDIAISLAAAAMAMALLEAWRHLFTLAARADGPAVAQRCRATWKRYLLGVGLIVGIALLTNVAEPLGLRLPSPLFESTVVVLTVLVAVVLVWMWWVTVGLTRELVRVLG